MGLLLAYATYPPFVIDYKHLPDSHPLFVSNCQHLPDIPLPFVSDGQHFLNHFSTLWSLTQFVMVPDIVDLMLKIIPIAPKLD